jgi:adenylate kinase family enzyme
MNNQMVVAITGPAGAGKSTVSERLAKQLGHYVNIDADHIKHMIVSGFYHDEAQPEDETKWGFNEWGLVGESIGLLARNFQTHGFGIIINGYIDEPAWENIGRFITFTHKVLLLPRLDTAIARDKGRHEDFRQGEAAIKRHHQHFTTHSSFDDFIKIDSTDLSADETADKIMHVLEMNHETV